MKQPKMIDNKRNGRVIDELKKNLRKGSKLSVISAYFTIYAFAELKKELMNIDGIRFIFTEPTFINKENEQSREYYIEHNNEKKVSGNEFEIKLRNEMRQAAIARECAAWIKEKVQVKSFKQSNPAQPRLVYIENEGEHVSINGTVDFTTDGLGITPSNRIDSNMCMYGKEFTYGFLQAFNELWNDDSAVDDIKQQVLNQMQVLYKENTPEFIYFVTLYNIFSNYLNELTEDNIVKSKTGFKETLIWKKLYQFQKDGVMGAIDKLEKYNGCIIADSVGLGKTFTALAIIKYYELRNDRVLVLAPKKLRDNWAIYTLQNDKRNILADDRFNYDVLSHTDLSRYSGKVGDIDLATLNWSNYDLIVIDESHNFRNNPPVKGRVTRYERMMNEVIKAGVKTKVLMLSATPVNNKMTDIKNQIAFITEGKDNAFASAGLPSIEFVLRKAQTVFNKWSSLPDKGRTTEAFVDMMDVDYFKLLDTVTIARSRKHIEKYYNLNEIGKFPTRLPPKNIYASIDTQNKFPPIESINKLIKQLTLGVYSPITYILPEKRESYSKKYDIVVAGGSIFKQQDREASLVGLMRVGILKRMESSIHSFTMTVKKILDKISTTIETIDQNQFEYDSEMDINDLDLDDAELENLTFGNKTKVLLQDMDLIRWRQDLTSDREKLERILSKAKEITPKRDEKLRELEVLIKNKIEHPINEGNHKIIIFTAFADTANYLYENLSGKLLQNEIYSAIVTGSGNNQSTVPIPKDLKKSIRITDLNTVLTLFSPKSKECANVYPQMKDQIDVLIATDCISEGQNLQDCDYLVNYDIHWNPVRIIQRFGRIDRIGSENESVQLVNFWAMKDLDAYINLQQRVRGRMVLLNVSATGDDDIIESDEEEEMKDLEYRKKQLQQLKDHVVDLEDISGGISITDLTFNDFKIDLMEFMKTNRKLLADAPDSMYAIAKIDDYLRDEIKPGLLFTLRQVKGTAEQKENNPLFPYYLMYVTEDGEVQLSYLHAKKILDYYKKLCSGQHEVLTALVQEFNAETDNGIKMGRYSDLLSKAIENLIGTKQEIGVASLFSKGGTTLQKGFYSGIEDFELVSFLIIK